MDLIARSGIGDNECGPLTRSIHFDSVCDTQYVMLQHTRLHAVAGACIAAAASC